MRVALCVSGHGFGHAVRSATVGQEVLARGHELLVRTDAPAWLFPSGARVLPSPGWPLDVGVAQYDGLELDIDETRRRWAAFDADFEVRARTEARQLAEAGADVVLGDVPPLAFAAAAEADIPSLAMTNFGWDWIYAAWPGFERPVRRIQSAYARADALLRLPLHDAAANAFSAFRRVLDVPLVARPVGPSRVADMRGRLALPDGRPAVLLSFGGFDVGRLDLGALGRWRDYLFLVTPPVSVPAELPDNVRVLPRVGLDYVALIAACDAVVTKPGYGIAADCLANRVPVLYTDRGPFREYTALVEGLERLGPARYVPSDEVRRGWLGPHLGALLAQPRRWLPLRLDGASVVVDHLARFVPGAPPSERPPAVAGAAVQR